MHQTRVMQDQTILQRRSYVVAHTSFRCFEDKTLCTDDFDTSAENSKFHVSHRTTYVVNAITNQCHVADAHQTAESNAEIT